MLIYTKVLDFLNTQIIRAQGAAITPPNEGGTSAVFSSLSSFVNFVINLVFGVGIAISLVFLIVCGIKYATSSGDQSKAEEARNCITNAIIGAVVIIAFRLLVNLGLSLFGFGDIDSFFGQTGTGTGE